MTVFEPGTRVWLCCDPCAAVEVTVVSQTNDLCDDCGLPLYVVRTDIGTMAAACRKALQPRVLH